MTDPWLTANADELKGKDLYGALAEAAGWEVRTYPSGDSRYAPQHNGFQQGRCHPTIDRAWAWIIAHISTTDALLTMVSESRNTSSNTVFHVTNHAEGIAGPCYTARYSISNPGGDPFVGRGLSTDRDKAIREALARALLTMFQAQVGEKGEEG